MSSLPPKHSSEEQRLQALHSYEILDTPPEADFDAIAELVAYICDTPVALVTLVDQDRQWFKATCGLDLRETSLEPSLCAYAILEEEIMVIPDMQKDPRCQNNPFMEGDPYLRFYAAALLKTDEGLPIGTLCVMDYRPRYLEERQLKALKSLARQAMALVTLRRDSRGAQIAQAKLQSALEESNQIRKDELQTLATLVEMQRSKYEDVVPQSELERLSEHIKYLINLNEQRSAV